MYIMDVDVDVTVSVINLSKPFAQIKKTHLLIEKLFNNSYCAIILNEIRIKMGIKKTEEFIDVDK